MRWLTSLCACAVVLCAATSVQAFCGFYVKQDDERITSRASRVVLLRDGTTTVLSMQSTYEGPPEDFALIVPVPTAIGQDDVRTLDPEIFDRIDQLTSPRLVEYWEQAPECADGVSFGYGGLGLYGTGRGGGGGVVTIEAAFAVGEYDVVILSASESSGLEDWLRQEGYRIPDGAGAALRPYVDQGFRFFVARVNAERVHFADGHALLSPLRIRYDSQELALPVRLGMLSSPGTQDLIVYVVSRDGRYEVANRDNVLVPTNLELRPAVAAGFGAFYDALLDRVWERHPGAVVTEYAWSATSCDPCPGPTMSAEDITTIGGDVASGAVRQLSGGIGMAFGPVVQRSGPRVAFDVGPLLREHTAQMQECVEQPFSFHVDLAFEGEELLDARVAPDTEAGRCIARALLGGAPPRAARSAPVSDFRVAMSIQRTVTWAQSSAHGFTVTRLRYRYGASSPATDLVFRRARPITGGIGEPDERGRLPEGSANASVNTFQPRYAILHRRRSHSIEGCRNVMRGGWGGPPPGRRQTSSSARALDGVVRRAVPVRLEDLVRTPVPFIGLTPRTARPSPARAASRRPARSVWLLPLFAFGAVILGRVRRKGSPPR
jgi:hypothetical protein